MQLITFLPPETLPAERLLRWLVTREDEGEHFRHLFDVLGHLFVIEQVFQLSFVDVESGVANEPGVEEAVRGQRLVGG